MTKKSVIAEELFEEEAQPEQTVDAVEVVAEPVAEAQGPQRKIAEVLNGSPETLMATVETWRAEVRERALAGSLRDLSTSIVLPRGQNSGERLVIDVWGIYSVIASWDGNKWSYHVEINP